MLFVLELTHLPIFDIEKKTWQKDYISNVTKLHVKFIVSFKDIVLWVGGYGVCVVSWRNRFLRDTHTHTKLTDYGYLLFVFLSHTDKRTHTLCTLLYGLANYRVDKKHNYCWRHGVCIFQDLRIKWTDFKKLCRPNYNSRTGVEQKNNYYKKKRWIHVH